MSNSGDDIQLLKKTINEKDQQIGDLEKKLRLEQFRVKKQQNELNAKIENEKSTAQNNADQINRFELQISDLKSKVAMKFIFKLSETEKKNLQLIEEISALKKRRASGSTDEDFQPKKEHQGDFPSLQQILGIIQANQGNYQPELTKMYECYTEACQSKDEQINSLKEEIKDLTQQLDIKQSDSTKQLEQLEERIKSLKQSLDERENELKNVVQQTSDNSDQKIQELEKQYQTQLSEKDKQLQETTKKAKFDVFKLNKQLTEQKTVVESEQAKTNLLQQQIDRQESSLREFEIKLSELEQKNLLLIEEAKQKQQEIERLNEESLTRVQVEEIPQDKPSYEELVEFIQKFQVNEINYQQELKNLEEELNLKNTHSFELQEELNQYIEKVQLQDRKYQESMRAIKALEEQQISERQVAQELQHYVEQLKQEKEHQQAEFIHKIKELGEHNTNVDDAVNDVEQKFQKMMMIQEEQYQRREQELIHQIEQSEEKLSQQEQLLKKQEQKYKNEIKQSEENNSQMIQQKQLQVTQLQKQLQDETHKIREDSNKQINELKQENYKKEKSLEQKIQEVTKQYEGELSKIRKMEIVLKKKEREIAEEKEAKKFAEEQLQILTEKSNKMIEQYDNKIKEIQIANQVNKQDQHRNSIFDQRMSISSSDINKTFEIEVLKAQIEQLQSKGDIELQAEINRLNERERALKKELLDLQNEIGNERLNFMVVQRQLEKEVESLHQEINNLKQDHQSELDEINKESNKNLSSQKNDFQTKINKLEQKLELQASQFSKKQNDIEEEKENIIQQLKIKIKSLEEQIIELKDKKTIKNNSQQVVTQDDTIQLQQEIVSLNEKERVLRKELLDLQNEIGNLKLSHTIKIRELETLSEQYKQEANHAQQEQDYAEQMAAKLSVQYAELAMEYENVILQNRTYRKSISKLKQ
ncbi:unnamed protein product (macronuclear) [Paramecium tetraurelia]|uniref:Uncharacterized protein n=1 Tax=Paramecium tetraurelia TaxID=5888 RepID=A0BYX7_PARTE|nr:uncharacterized protein GSPATT00033597001 [Paramecium tetraurelia]CAK63744.1 unnamed protein product [Paramecium tetraurelia]|eukprot:XP_001431142.1 hypothetical protein (macronuclear) [Paramecium tetraurelia strain d4-2]